jgi:hypothetical protein
MAKKRDNLLITAYHEAGHAIANKVLGLKLRLVTIVPKGDYAGVVKGAIGINVERLRDDDFSVDEVSRWHNEIIVLLAGAEAQKKFRPRSMKPHMVAADNANIQTILENLHPSNERRAIMTWLRVRTRNLINHPKHWRYIEDLAGVLIERPTLTGDEVSDVIAESFKRQTFEARQPS